MQITSGSGGFSPYSPSNDFSDNNTPLGGQTPTKPAGDPQMNIPTALNFGNIGATDKPSQIDFGSSPQNRAVDNSSSPPADGMNGSNGNSMESMLKMLQQMLQELMQELFKMLGIGGGQAPQQDNASPPPVSDSSGGGGDGGGGGPGGVNTPTNNVNLKTDTPPTSDLSEKSSTSGANGSGNSSTPGDTSMPGLPDKLQQFSKDYSDIAKETGVPASTLAALTWTESRGDVNATSTNPGNGKTDGGMNQINPDTYESMRQKYPDKLSGDSSDPHNQIMCSALMLRDYQKQFGGSMDAALRAYNSGPDQVNMSNLSSISLGNPNYVNEVNQTAKVIASGNGSVPA
ncbi:lytic transglycosylase domain-containing protein [Paramixta manurensis]|uniref:Lytic transglycosylase domain-containing protein n=1 Tax=Paramixta manurensis TaxID=2740817 RepID=A0A6M8UHN0_9GAMM|nr:lytic transglycosylase domain-containing protein [Erwiniaceae bacterium PD-1]